MPSPLEFTQRANLVRAFIQGRGVTTIIRVESIKHFRQSFQDEGFTDVTLKPWKDISEKRKEQKRKRNGDLPKILTMTGELANSIDGKEEGRNVVIYSDKDYAKAHNEGTNKLPKRQFMGPSRVLDKKITQKLDKELRRRFGL